MAENTNKTRRDFLKTSIAGVSALTILPSTVVSGLGHPAPVDKLNIAAIGIGGVGYRNLTNLQNENIVALCDVDATYGKKAFRKWSNARQYVDFREMLDREKGIDGVVIATPDHTHAVAAMAAMQLQKHVYVQAPMAHAIFEMRRMNETARVFNVVSQVGNQSASASEVKEICELLWSGAIGEITEVHAWTSHPHLDPNREYARRDQKEPKDLNWNMFVGPAEKVDYHPAYTPYGWRSWWNFGNGALGSMGPHILQPVFEALKLKAPAEVEASSTTVNLTTVPTAEKITFTFNKRDNLPKLAMPELKLHWYDGGLKPEMPADFPADLAFGNEVGGLLLIGEEGMLVCDPEGQNYKVIVDGEVVDTTFVKSLRRVENPFNGGHEMDWVRACKENAENRLLPTASFDKQTALTETILVGVLAVKMQSLGKKLKWDSGQMRFVNINDYEEFTISERGNLYFENGIARYDVNSEAINAARFVEQQVRPIYREGWKQI